MGLEIERKFLVKEELWQPEAPGQALRQGYLSTEPGRTVRIRVAEDQAWITIKGLATGFTRAEFEYEIPVEDAHQLLALCPRPPVDKTRYRQEFAGQVWEIDVFTGSNRGLLLAECELKSEQEEVVLPPWVGAEVTGDHRYQNSSLYGDPFTTW